MSTMKLSAKGGGDFFRLRFWATALLLLGISLMLCMGEASALAPAAGSSIGNQASATYTDNAGISRITVSNAVSTIVQQVSNSTLTQSQTRSGAPGQPITFSHTIVNNGNGPESYTLTAANLTGTTLSVLPSLYADANCDGVADNSTVITTLGPVPANTQACFVAVGTLTTNSTTSSTFTIAAVSSVSATAIGGSPNTDTAQILANGVINITKAVSRASGAAGTVVTYSLTYRNTGTQTAYGVVLADVLQTGVAFSGTLNANLNGTALTAGGGVTGSTPNRANLSYGSAGAAGGKIVLVIESVAPNTQGVFSFDAIENGPGPINNNNAQFCYRDASPTATTTPASVATACDAIIGTTTAGTGSGVLSGTPSGTYQSTILVDSNISTGTGIATTTNPNITNTVPFNVTATTSTGVVRFNDGTTAGGGGDGTAGPAGNVTDGNNPANYGAIATATAPDVNVVASAAQGATVTFNNWVWNSGAVSDTFNITAVTGNTFPAGTSFLFLRSDGNTPLTDSDGDGNLDTGPIAGTSGGGTCPAGSPNATAGAATPCAYRVVVKAILPASASGAGPFNLLLQAASSLTPSATNTVADQLTAVVAATMDLRTPFATTNGGAPANTVPYTLAGNTWAAGCSFTDVTPNPISPTTGSCSTYVTGGGTGQQAAGEAAPVVTYSVNPGSTAVYKLDVVNTGTVPDSYDLSYNATSGAWTTAPGWTTTTSLPSGYSVQFYADGGSGNCSGTFSGAAVSNTGVVAAAATKLFCAVVTAPTGAANATYDLFFRAVSPTTNTATTGSSGDVLHTRLYVNAFRSISFTPNGAGQVFPGGSISYCHTITNLGNVAESGMQLTGGATNTATPATPAWPANATYYLDTNKNCQLDGTEGNTPLSGTSAVASVPIYSGPGTNSVNYIVVLQAPLNATAGQTVVTRMTATPTGTISGAAAPAAQSVTDTTTVVVGQVSLVKSQVTDATCAQAFTAGTTPTGTFSVSQIQARPGDCIIYQVVATNVGTTSVSAMQIFDATPPNTTCYGTPWYVPAGQPVASGTNLTSGTNFTAGACTPATTATTNFNTSAQTLTPNQTTTLYMRVRVNQ